MRSKGDFGGSVGPARCPRHRTAGLAERERARRREQPLPRSVPAPGAAAVIRSYSGLDPATGRPLSVRVADGHIVDVSASTGEVEGWLAPGLVDLQVNGFAGFDV